jgi:hypothetical protein
MRFHAADDRASKLFDRGAKFRKRCDASTRPCASSCAGQEPGLALMPELASMNSRRDNRRAPAYGFGTGDTGGD